LRCPVSGASLVREGDALVTASGDHRYPIGPSGIPLFAGGLLSSEAQAQRAHYDKIAAAYTTNLGYPHTQEYMAYLDRVTLQAAGDKLGVLVELCCGHGEALKLFGRRAQRYVGVDVSENMLNAALALHDHPDALFVQADATHAPLANESADTVVMLGGFTTCRRARLVPGSRQNLKAWGGFSIASQSAISSSGAGCAPSSIGCRQCSTTRQSVHWSTKKPFLCSSARGCGR